MSSSEEWLPDSEKGSSERQFKWGHDSQTGRVAVWEVSGPGDGFPWHSDYLLEAWGRDVVNGDGIGTATQHDGCVSIFAFYKKEVPVEVVAWFRERYPDNAIVIAS
jgi:hypothetical protein